ncbi:MAG: hypothetical protein NVS2B16_03060 [Chloroflexota bacterium]
MNEEGKERFDTSMRDYLRARVSRAQALKAAGIAMAAAAIPGAASAAASGDYPTPSTPAGALSLPFYPQVQGTYQPETFQQIINVALTAEHLAVTFLTNAIYKADAIGLTKGPKDKPGLFLQVIQAQLLEELLHAQFLEAVGAKTITDTFTPDPAAYTGIVPFFKNVEVADTIFVAAYETANREFAELGQPTLAKYAYQIGAVEAEHRVFARTAQALSGESSAIPPNNKAYETDLFLYVSDAAATLIALGVIGHPTRPQLTYPGADAALAAAGDIGKMVIQRSPNNATSPIVPSAANVLGERS